MRLTTYAMVIAVCFGCFASTAAACLNDSELPDREREFRSQYLHETLVTSNDANPDDQLWAMKSTGFVLMIGAVGLTRLGRSKNANPRQQPEADVKD